MSDTRASTDTVRLTVNGTEIEAPKGQLVIDAVEAAGVFIPRFCYHPRMKPVGMCRMCIVDIDTGRGPALQPSCMVNVADGMTVDTESKTTKKAQDGVLEFLLVNHPLDCPVCDKGGECPLQDNAYAYGPGESRMVEEKRHVEKPIPVSGLVLLDRERCILCDRCTRFAKEVAGDPLIHFQGRGADSEVNTFPDHPFASYFSGNTVQICPVGALTAAPYRFKARPWDVEKAESTCTSCAMGCRVTVETSRNHVLRYQGVDVDPVNWGWLCDKGRFDFEAIESDDRLGEPLVRKGDELVHAGWAEALGAAAEAIRKAPADRIGVIGGSRLSNEAAYAWAKLAKGIIGTDNVDAQLGDGLPGEAVIGLPQATIDDACAARSVIVMAGDVKEELPVLFLRLRDAVQNRGLKIIEVGPVASGLTPYAAVSLRHRPGEAGEVVRALLHGTPGVESPVLAGDLSAAQALLDEAPVVIYGRQSLAESPAAVVDAAAAVNAALPGARFLAALRRANTRGAIDLGLAPGLLPGHRRLADGAAGEGWSKLPSHPGLDTTGILAAAAAGRLDVLVLLGADPLGDFPDHDLASRAIAGARTIVAVDTFLNDSSRKADVVLAAAGYAETAGTTTNFEGRISLLHQRVTPPGVARADWIIAAELAHRLGADLGLESPEDIWAEIEQTSPAHAGITLELLRSSQGQDGVLAPMTAQAVTAAQGTPVWVNSHHPVLEATTEAGAGDLAADSPEEVAEAQGAASEAVEDAAADAAEAEAGDEPDPVDAVTAPANDRQTLLAFTPPAPHTPPALDKYSLRLVATRKLYDNGTLVQHSPSLAALSPGSTLRLNPADLERLGRASGDRVKVSSSRTSATLEAHADAAVPAGSALLVFRQPGVDPAAFVDADQPVTDIRVETV